MKRIDIILTVFALATGSLTAYSINGWLDGVDRGYVDAQRAKEELVRNAGLFELHNAIYLKVGAYNWETRVKPKFMSELTYATIRETGKLIPEAKDVINWVQVHPTEARRMLEEASNFGEPFWQ